MASRTGIVKIDSVANLSLHQCARPSAIFVAGKEIKKKLRVCTSLAQFIEDVGVVEGASGKQLLKLSQKIESSNTAKGSSTLASVDGGASQPSNTIMLARLSEVWDCVLRTSTATKGQQCASISSTLSQSIGKCFPDHVTAFSKRIKINMDRVKSLADNVTKLRQSYQKAQTAYLKLVQDTEAAIRARDDNAAIAAEKEQSELKSGDKDKEGDFMNRAKKVTLILSISISILHAQEL